MFHDSQMVLAFIAGYSLQDVFNAVVKNLPTLAWVLLVPYMLFKNPQGRELLTGMFDEADKFTGIRAAAILPLFHLIALALYFVPTAIFPDAAPEEVQRLRPVTKDLTPAVIACSLPMIFYSLAVYVVQLKRFKRWWTILPVAGLLALAIWGALCMLDADRPRFPLWLLDLLVVANMLLAFSLIFLIQRANERRRGRNRPPVHVLWNYLCIGLCLSIQMILIAGSLRQSEWLYLNQIGTYNTHYLIMLIATTVLVIAAAWAPNLQPLSPTFVLLGITLFYLLIGDLISAAYLLLPAIGRYILSGLLALFAYLTFFSRSRIHDMRLWPTNMFSGVRKNLDEYFEAWWQTNIVPELGKARKIPVFLLATQGGGSRAGYWTSQLVSRLNLETNGKFRRHLFAVTSASGGSSGFGATLGMWKFLDEHPDLSPEEIRAIQEGFAAKMYQRNYLSGAFYQIFVGEIGTRIKRLFTRKAYNRNYTHRMDECVAFGEAIKQGLANPAPSGKPFFEEIKARIATFFKHGNIDPIIQVGARQVPNYLIRPYLNYWYKSDRSLDASLPLYFPITMNIQSGRSGYASPVRMDSAVFIDTIDIVAEAEQNQDARSGPGSVSMVDASQLSQLFPLMNAYTYIPGCGNFIDGGLFENQGFTLMSRLYEWLEARLKTLPDDVRSKVSIHVISLINGSIRPDTSSGPVEEKNKRISQLKAVMRAVSFSGIAGRATWWTDYMKNRVPAGNFHEIVLQYPNFPSDESKRVPLGRWLSSGSINTMKQRLEGKGSPVAEQWKTLAELL
ncbi:MAG TPA: hypothetical protein PLW66_01510 [Saprospiraceae bacterium]|nr:hypothetical protein [Saprospiraceae bacterium]